MFIYFAFPFSVELSNANIIPLPCLAVPPQMYSVECPSWSANMPSSVRVGTLVTVASGTGRGGEVVARKPRLQPQVDRTLCRP